MFLIDALYTYKKSDLTDAVKNNIIKEEEAAKQNDMKDIDKDKDMKDGEELEDD